MNRAVRLWVVTLIVTVLTLFHFVSRSVEKKNDREAFENEAVQSGWAKLKPQSNGKILLVWEKKDFGP